MIIKKVTMNSDVKIKVYEKHNVTAEEIEDVIIKNKPIFKKVGGNQYITIGNWNRYLTIFFTYNSKIKEAIVTTAYPSDKKQIKYHKRMVK